MNSGLIQNEYMHKAQFISTTTLFSTDFNAYTPGKYDFSSDPTCQNINVFTLEPGTIYWIKRLSSGGNIPQEDYLGSIVTLPSLSIKRSNQDEIVFRYPIPITKYIDNAGCEAWIWTDHSGATLDLTLGGLCTQLPSMIGIITITISISLGIFAFNDSNFCSKFRGAISG